MTRDVGLFQKSIQLAQDNEGLIYGYQLKIAFVQEEELVYCGYKMHVDNKKRELTIIRDASESPEHELIKLISYLSMDYHTSGTMSDETFRIEVENLLKDHHNQVRSHG